MRLVEELLKDEARHIEYSLSIINRLMNAGNRAEIFQLFKRRVNDLNEETLKETGGSAEGYFITRINGSVIRMDEANANNEEEIFSSTV